MGSWAFSELCRVQNPGTTFLQIPNLHPALNYVLKGKWFQMIFKRQNLVKWIEVTTLHLNVFSLYLWFSIRCNFPLTQIFYNYSVNGNSEFSARSRDSQPLWRGWHLTFIILDSIPQFSERGSWRVSSLVAQRIKDLVLSLLCLWLLLWCGFDPWLGNFHMPGAQTKKTKQNIVVEILSKNCGSRSSLPGSAVNEPD